MTEAERARDLADFAEREGYIDISEAMPDDAEDLRIWIKGARLLAVSEAPAADLREAVEDAIADVGPQPLCSEATDAALSGIDRAGFAIVTKAFIREVEAVVASFEKDEKSGYRSKDRQFAIDVLGLALRMKAVHVPVPKPVDVAALRLQAAADAMSYAVEEGGVEFLEAWLEDDVARMRREWPQFDLSSLNKSKRAAPSRG
jgi:hypothetical protein